MPASRRRILLKTAKWGGQARSNQRRSTARPRNASRRKSRQLPSSGSLRLACHNIEKPLPAVAHTKPANPSGRCQSNTQPADRARLRRKDRGAAGGSEAVQPHSQILWRRTRPSKMVSAEEDRNRNCRADHRKILISRTLVSHHEHGSLSGKQLTALLGGGALVRVSSCGDVGGGAGGNGEIASVTESPALRSNRKTLTLGKVGGVVFHDNRSLGPLEPYPANAVHVVEIRYSSHGVFSRVLGIAKLDIPSSSCPHDRQGAYVAQKNILRPCRIIQEYYRPGFNVEDKVWMISGLLQF